MIYQSSICYLHVRTLDCVIFTNFILSDFNGKNVATRNIFVATGHSLGNCTL